MCWYVFSHTANDFLDKGLTRVFSITQAFFYPTVNVVGAVRLRQGLRPAFDAASGNRSNLARLKTLRGLQKLLSGDSKDKMK